MRRGSGLDGICGTSGRGFTGAGAGAAPRAVAMLRPTRGHAGVTKQQGATQRTKAANRVPWRRDMDGMVNPMDSNKIDQWYPIESNGLMVKCEALVVFAKK